MLKEELQAQILEENRRFMMGYRKNDPNLADFESDQERKLPQPPLTKAPMRPESARIALPLAFENVELEKDLFSVLRDRKSARIYTNQTMSLSQLSFLLWATQGVKALRGKAYATLRTVPSGGARHTYETYLVVLNVEDLQPGTYHYLPMEHALEFLDPVPDPADAIGRLLNGQKWAAKANVVFFWAADIRRAEWRYGIYAHRTALIDAGHIGQNLYLAATGLGLGTCGIAAFSHEDCCDQFELDGEQEFVVYAAPVGTIRPEDQEEELCFYRFVQEEGL